MNRHLRKLQELTAHLKRYTDDELDVELTVANRLALHYEEQLVALRDLRGVIEGEIQKRDAEEVHARHEEEMNNLWRHIQPNQGEPC